MPELPEVETIARTLAPQIVGKRIAAVHLLHPKSLHAGQELFAHAVPDARILRVFRRAKLLLVEIAPQKTAKTGAAPLLFMVFHLKMTGRFFVHPPGTPPLKHTRIIFDLADEKAHAMPSNGEKKRTFSEPSRLFFDDIRTFGYCRIMQPEELPLWPFWAMLGPEPLDTPDAELATRFTTRRASIKSVLLDQRIVAGVGNIYADEALFRTGILPTATASGIDFSRLTGLAAALRAILLLSIEECGSSIRDYRDANGNAGAFQNSFAVYGRKGQLCLTCNTPLSFCRVAGRGTVFCPRCQQ